MDTDEDLGKTVRRLRAEVSRLQDDLGRLRTQVVVWPVLTLTVLMLFWPTFDAAGKIHGEYASDDGPVALAGLWQRAVDRDLVLLGWLVVAAVVLHVVLVLSLVGLAEAGSAVMPRVVQAIAGLFGALYLFIVFSVSQDDGEGTFGREGYQPSGSWLLMVAMVAGVLAVAQAVRNDTA